MGDFSDKVVLITGAGRGLGRALAEAFGGQGARVAANDLTPINLDRTVERVRAAGGTIQDYVFDVAKKMPVQAMLEQIHEAWGRLDILINNAGVEPHFPLLDMDDWDWQRTLDVNLSGPFYLMQSAARLMREQGGGVMVNIAASAGRAHGLAGQGAYIASKMGLIGLTRAAAQEFAAYNIRVNAVCPGLIETELTAPFLQDNSALQRSLEDIPLQRPGQPAEVTGLVLFLCSPAAAFLTGQAINVDGGQIMC